MSIEVKAPSAFARFGGQSMLAGLDSTGRLYVHGGIGSGSAYDTSQRELERYDPVSDAWTTLAASAQFQTATAWIIDSADRIIYATGRVFSPPGNYYGTNHGEIYDPSGDTWAAIPSLPLSSGTAGGGGRRDALYWIDSAGRLNVAAGFAESTATFQDGVSSGHPQDWWRYSGGASGTWTQLTTGGMGATDVAGAPDAATPPIVDGSGNPWESMDSVEAGASGSFWRMNTLTGGFIQSSVMPANSDASLSIRGFGSTAALLYTDDFLYIAGGVYLTFGPTVQHYQKTCFRYDPFGNSWIQIADLPYELAWGVLVSFGAYLYYLGGTNEFAPRDEILRYDPVADTWAVTADTLSVARSKIAVVRSLDGLGFWLYGGTLAPQPFSNPAGFTNVLEWWVPEAAAVVQRRGRSWAQVVG